MKHNFFLFITIFLISFAGISQEIVTDIKNPGANTQDFVYTIDSVNYLLRIAPDDEVSVYYIINEDSVTIKSSRYIDGAYYDFYIRFRDRYMFFGRDSIAIAYNIPEDKFLNIEIPAGFEFNYWGFIKDGYAVLSVSGDENSGRTMIFDLDNHSYEILDFHESVVKSYSDYFFIKKYPDSIALGSYYIFNTITKTKDTLFTDVPDRFYTYPVNINNTFWYVAADGSLNSYNTETKEKESFQMFGQSLKKENKVLREGDYLYILNYDNQKLLIRKFDLNTNLVTKSFSLNLSSYVLYRGFSIHSGKLVALSHENILVIDLETGSERTFETGLYVNSRLQVIADRYIIHKYLNKVLLLDLKYLSQITLHSNESIEINNKFTAVQIDDKKIFIACKQADPYYSRALFYIDLNMMQYFYAENLEFTNAGLFSYAGLKNFNDHLMVFDKDIYDISTGNDIKVNEYPLNDILSFVRYKIENDKVYYIEHDSAGLSYRLMGYDGINNNLVVNLSKYFSEYEIQGLVDFSENGDAVYTATYYGLNRLNKPDSSMTLLLEHFGYLDGFGEVFFKYKNYLFFRNGSNLYRVLENEEPHVFLELEPYKPFLMFRLKNKPYLFANDHLYSMTGNGVESIYEFPLDSGYVYHYDFYYFDKKEQNILFYFDVNGDAFHFDGDEVFYFKTDRRYNPKDFGNGVYLVSRAPNTIYDGNKKELDTIPITGDDEIINDVFFSQGDTFLITSVSYNTTRIYKVDNKFQSLSPFQTYHYNIVNNTARFLEFGDFGLLYSGNSVYLMDKNTKFTKLNNITATYYNYNAVQKDSFIYFIANDKVLGNQVFRIKMKTPTGINPISIEKLKIYPNPSNDYINIVSENLNSGHYRIYDVEGNVVKTGELMNHIDISGLLSGHYFIIVEKNNNIFTGIFEKM